MASPALVLTLFTAALVTCSELDSRMFNGEEIGVNEFKFLVEIELQYSTSKNYKCSGSILNPHWIITAAHCVSSPGQITQARVTRLKSTPASPPLSFSGTVIRHPNYVPGEDPTKVPSPSIKFDMALLRTAQPIQFNQFVEPITLGRLPALGQVAFVAGYGLPVNEARKSQMTLTHCQGNGYTPTLCSLRSGNMPRTGHGDSGGPVVANGVLVGVVSGTRTPPSGTYYENVFADIESSYGWIQSVIST